MYNKKFQFIHRGLTEVSECMYIYSLVCIVGNTNSNRAQKSCRQREEPLQVNFEARIGGIKATTLVNNNWVQL